MAASNGGKQLFSIGYGNRSFSSFMELLQKNGIEYLVDVRTKPYSKYNPDFIKEILESKLKDNRIRYVFMGDQIGGMPSDLTCYSDGKVDYDKCKAKESFIVGIERLITALAKSLTVAIMCSESKPHECHRSKLLGVMLQERGYELMHIDEEGIVVPQTHIIDRLTKSQMVLFGELQKFTSRKRYKGNNDAEGE